MSREYQDEETLRRLYNEEGLSQRKIAERFGVSQTTVCYHMNRHGIETREKGGNHQ